MQAGDEAGERFQSLAANARERQLRSERDLMDSRNVLNRTCQLQVTAQEQLLLVESMQGVAEIHSVPRSGFRGVSNPADKVILWSKESINLHVYWAPFLLTHKKLARLFFIAQPPLVLSMLP